jgi:hypothetical protein
VLGRVHVFSSLSLTSWMCFLIRPAASRRGSLIASSIDANPSDLMALRCHAQSTVISKSANPKWRKGEIMLATNLKGSSKVVLTLFQGNPSDPPHTFVGQVRLTLCISQLSMKVL